MVTWTREEIIRQILEREAAGLPLTLRKNGIENSLCQAGSRVFGSWENALKAAGVAPGLMHSPRRWSPLLVLRAIRDLSRRRRPLSPDEIKRHLEPLMSAARRIYGSWPKALVTAGVDPLKFRRVRPWTKDRIIEAILKRALNNEPLSSCTVRPSSLADAAVRVFGSWKAALLAGGLDPKQYTAQRVRTRARATRSSVHRYRRRWSDEMLIAAIRKRVEEGRYVNAVAVKRSHEGLYSAARRRYGGWRKALAAAGFNPDASTWESRRKQHQKIAQTLVLAKRETVLDDVKSVASSC